VVVGVPPPPASAGTGFGAGIETSPVEHAAIAATTDIERSTAPQDRPSCAMAAAHCSARADAYPSLFTHASTPREDFFTPTPFAHSR
jgi:hypothetical protein